MERRISRIAMVAAGLAIVLVLTGPALGDGLAEMAPAFATQRSVSVFGYELTVRVDGQSAPNAAASPAVVTVPDDRAVDHVCDGRASLTVIVLPRQGTTP